MKKNLTDHHGFTLIESMIAGTISAVVIAGLVTFLFVYNRAAKDGAANAQLQMQSEVALEQISRDIWSAIQIVGPAEAFSGTPSAVEQAVSEIHLYNADTLIFAAYRIENGELKEAHPDPAVAAVGADLFQPFTVGNSLTVKVSAGSNFALAPLRRSVTLNLGLTTTQSGVTYTTPSRGDLVTCRN